MRILSATEAISPSLQRTKDILFHPFRKGRSWKLAAVAYLSAMGLAFIPYPLIFFMAPLPHRELPMRIVMAVAGLFITAILLVFFYLGSRLQFVLFAIAAEKSEMVAPLWRRYGSRTWPWTGLKLILSLVVSAIFAAPILYAFRSFIGLMATQQLHPGQPPSPAMFAGILSFYALIFVPVAILMLASSLLSDFVLPSIALEDAPLGTALGRFFQLIKAEPGQLCIFIVFKVIFAIAGMIAMQIAVILAELIAFISLGLIALLGWFLFRSLGAAGHLLLVAGGIMLAIVFTVFLFYVIILVLGCVHMFYQAYALYFLGGRYPLLGDLLEPPIPDFTSAPPFPGLPPAPPIG